jgi:hypothetical protein
VLRDVFRQISPFAIFEKNVKISPGLLDINKVDDVLIFEVVEEFNFSLKDLNFIVLIKKRCTFNFISGNDFDCNFFFLVGIAKIDFGKGSLADKFVGNSVGTNSFAFHVNLN